MGEYIEKDLRKSIEMYSELGLKHRFFLHVGGRSVNNPNGVNATKELLESYEEFCKFIFSKNLLELYGVMISKFGRDLKKALDSALEPADWYSHKQLLESLEERINTASAASI